MIAMQQTEMMQKMILARAIRSQPEVARFVLNLYELFDHRVPPHIEVHLIDLLNLSELREAGSRAA